MLIHRTAFSALGAFLIGFCLLMAVGCASTPSGRIEQGQSEFDAYPAEVQSKIEAGDIDLGFDPEMVRMAMGDPTEVATVPDEDGPVTVWAFRYPWTVGALANDGIEGAAFSAILGFRDGRLVHAFLFGEEEGS